MARNTVKDMTTNFEKLDKFEGHDFRRWKKKIHLLLTTLKVVYVLTTPMPELVEDSIVEAIRIRAKWENDDYICRGHILKGMSDSLFDVYTNVESAKELILRQYTQHGLKMDESISVSSIIDKLPPSWKDFKHTLKHGKYDLSLVQLGSHLRIEDSLKAQESDKDKGKEVGGPSVNMTKEGKNKHNKQNKGKKRSKENNSGSSSNKKPKLECWKCGKTSNFKRECRSGKRTMQMLVVWKRGLRTNPKTKVDSIAWWIDSGATTHVCKDHIIHETTASYTPQQNGVAERKIEILKKWVVVRLPDPKRKTLDEKVIDCIFVGYAEHSKAYRFYVIEPNDYVPINSIIKSRDALFDENHFSSIPRPKDVIPNSVESQRDDHPDDVPSETPEPRNGKRVRKAKSYGFDFQLYLVEGSRDQVGSQYSYCYIIEDDPRTYDEAMQSRDAAFWKEAIDDEIGSIMENNTWVLSDLPHGCKPLGCKWIFKRKMKVNGTIDKFKARLVIQGFRQKERIDYFDTYAPVARITTIRLLLALAAINNLVIHQMDVKTTFLNSDLDEEVYIKQLEGFVMPGNEHKVCKLVKSLYGLKQAPKQIWDVILGIKIKHENKGIVITQSHYIEKIFKKFNREDCSPVITHMDPVEKLKPNTGKPMDQLEYSRAIGCLMYAMTSTRPDIAYAIGRLSRFTGNPSRQHWQVITRVFKYLKGTMNYGLSYIGYPSVLEGYSNVSWIKHVENSSSTSGWVFLLGGDAISWASKKQTCITFHGRNE
ncbi:zinc finger, CCHC-type containing protein [Tanacetum coccineum]